MARTREVSYSELDAYRQCRLKHELAYKERWRPAEESPALSRGRLFHEVLELHYRTLKETRSLEQSIAAVEGSGLLYDLMTGNETEQQELVAWVYNGYTERYRDDNEWEILEVETKVNTMLPNHKGNPSSFRFKGTVDLLVRDNSAGGGLWIVDHKTCSNLPKGKDLDLDDQMGLYTYLLRRQGLDIRGAIYSACRTKKLKRDMTMEERFKRYITVRGEVELKNIALEAYDTFREAYKPREGATPRSPDSERCGWRCPFTEPCLGGRKGLSIEEMLVDHDFVQDFTRH
jgi:RecB family exonuclease